jgi:hypothetical protein
VLGDDVGQGGFARAGGPVENQGAEPVGLEHAAEEFTRPEEMFLADELVHGPRPHPRRQGLRLAPVRLVRLLE